MMPPTISVAAVVATKGRVDELRILFASLAAQTRQLAEVVVVDQNEHEDLKAVLDDFPDLPLRWLRRRDLQGANASRNWGWAQASSDLVFFPDDDCWYPSDFVEKACALQESTGADIVSGRAADISGRSINGRFLEAPAWVTRKTAWITQIEWVFLIRKGMLQAIGGFDERIGPGAGTPWGSCEVQDLSLRAMAAGFRQIYHPEIYGHHEEFVVAPDVPDVIAKGAHYARGFGFVLGKHGFSTWTAAKWIARPAMRAIFELARFKVFNARYSFAVAMGRRSGFCDVLSSRRSAEDEQWPLPHGAGKQAAVICLA